MVWRLGGAICTTPSARSLGLFMELVVYELDRKRLTFLKRKENNSKHMALIPTVLKYE